jgi:carboxypeptidase C (cathepsin A)
MNMIPERTRVPRWAAVALAAALMSAGVCLAEDPPAAENAVRAQAPSGPIPVPRQFVTRHRGTFNGVAVAYTATAADTLIEDDSRTPIGYVFSFAYTRDNIPDLATRPVVFIFNGGPGSSSFWLHAGALGPKRAIVPDPGQAGAAPFQFVDNTASLLDVADLVFIDPVGTGFSYMLEKVRPEKFYGTEADAVVTTEFIRRWLSEHNRWNSPKVVLGESYGATRAALTTKLLMGGVDSKRFPAISLNGIVLFGASLEGERGDADTRFAIDLPCLAAAAWYHEKIDRAGRSVEALTAEARRFASQEYLPALFAGNALDPGERTRIAAKLQQYTGLPQSLILRRNLRVDLPTFATELLADRNATLSIYDARYTFTTTAAKTDAVGDDPSMTRAGPAILAGFMSYIRTDLGVRIDSRYEPISWIVNHQWKSLSEPYDMALDLARAMRQNPQLRLFIGAGNYDLITSLDSVQYALAHGEVPMDRVQIGRYDAGHMPYIGEQNVRRLSADLRGFIATVTRR